jgi:hypothetical protein
MFKRVVLAGGLMVGALFGLGAVSEAVAAGPHGHGHHGHGHQGHGGHGGHGLGHWSHGHGHWHGHAHFRPYYPQPYYPQPYYVPYAAPAQVYGYPYYYNRGPSLFIGSGGLSVRVPF